MGRGAPSPVTPVAPMLWVNTSATHTPRRRALPRREREGTQGSALGRFFCPCITVQVLCSRTHADTSLPSGDSAQRTPMSSQQWGREQPLRAQGVRERRCRSCLRNARRAPWRRGQAKLRLQHGRDSAMGTLSRKDQPGQAWRQPDPGSKQQEPLTSGVPALAPGWSPALWGQWPSSHIVLACVSVITHQRGSWGCCSIPTGSKSCRSPCCSGWVVRPGVHRAGGTWVLGGGWTEG